MDVGTVILLLAAVAVAYAGLRLYGALYGDEAPAELEGDVVHVIAVPCPLHGEFRAEVPRVVVDRSTRPYTYEAHCDACAGGVVRGVSPAWAAWLVECGAVDAADLAAEVDAGLAALARAPWGRERGGS